MLNFKELITEDTEELTQRTLNQKELIQSMLNYKELLQCAEL